MHVGTNASRRRHRITEINFERHVAFDELDEFYLEYDCCEHGNERVIVVRRTYSVMLSLLLKSFTRNRLCFAIFRK